MAAFTHFAPYSESTMDGYVREGNNLTFSRANNLFRTREGDVITSFQSIVCRYIDSLKPYITTKTFTKDEMERYRYNPRFLSYDLYGTPELWGELLYINNMVSVTEFKRETINVFTVNIIEALIEIKMIIENDLKDNKASIEEN